MNASSLLWGSLFGAFGLGYFVYGKKQKASDTILLVAIGLVLMAIPWFVRI